MIRASITYIAPSLSVTPLGPPTASVSYVAPVYSLSYEIPVAAVSYVLITYGAVTDNLGAYKRIRETTVVADLAALNLSKVFSQSATATEGVAISFGHGASDSAVSSEQKIIAFTKALTETPTAADVASIVMAYNRAFSDTAGATDDIFGQTNIDDDQTMVFTKVTTDAASASENFVRVVSFSRTFTETPVAAETVSKVFTTAYSDGSVAGDAAAKAFNTARADNSVASDAATLLVGLPQDDDTQAADSSVWSLGKNLSETPAASEDIAKAVALSFSDSVSVADLAVVSQVVAKAILDSAYVTDDLDGETTTEDDQTMAFTKVRVDSSQVTDTPVKLFGPVRSDSASASDSGSLLSQGYVDNPYYFAEDYVGDSRTF